jgi:hypothetical protein
LHRWSSALLPTVFFLATLALVSCGGNMSPTMNIAEKPQSAPPPPPTSTGSPTVIDNIEDSNNWLTCGACGNSGGTGALAHYSVTPNLPSPSEDGSATQFSIAATVPFTNAYWYQTHTPVQNQFTLLTYEFDLLVPGGMENAPQAIEFECQQILSGWVYNFAFQADYGRNLWRVFNYGAKMWESASIPLQQFAPETWHHIMAEYHNDTTTHTVFHDALTVDGVRYTVNMTHDAFFSGANDQFTNAFQLDSNGHPDAYNVYVDRMKVTYK